MKKCIENLINGNLKEARQQAAQFRYSDLIQELRNNFGYDENKVLWTVIYLKSGECYDEYCNA